MHSKDGLPLLILQTLQGGALHGYAIARRIRARSGGLLDSREGALYPALHGQENLGLVESFEKEEQGRVRRCYRLTARGRRALETARGKQERFPAAVTPVPRGGR